MLAFNTSALRYAPRFCISRLHDAGLAVMSLASAVVNRVRAARALSGYDARMLADIGLTTGDVASAFAEPVWRDPTRRLAVMAVERRVAVKSSRKLRGVEAAVQTCGELVGD